MKKKLLVLTPRYPYPVIGGDRLRIYQVCKALADQFDLTLLSLCETQEELEMPLPDDGVYQAVHRVYLSKWRSYFNCLLALPTRKPLQVAYYQSRDFAAAFAENLHGHDAVLCHLIRTSEYAEECGKPIITEFTDAISLNYSRVKDLAKNGGAKNFIYALEQARLKSYERQVGKRSSMNVFVSNVDVGYLFPPESEERKKSWVFSNGVDVEAYPFKPNRHSKEIAFIGNMQSVQNMDAALWFAKFVMPLLASDGFTFKVVGRISAGNKERLNSFSGVEATGGVDSVVAVLDESFIGVCPMRIGAGVQNKILEYMALGLPCIASSMGYEGLQAEIDRDIFVLDTKEDIARKIKQLYSSPEDYREAAAAGRQYVLERHSWHGKLQGYVTGISRLLGV